MKDKLLYIFIVVVVGLAIVSVNNHRKQTNSIIISSSDANTGEEVINSSEEIVETGIKKAYISGEVVNPGVYEIEDNFRIEDLVNLAGGFTDDVAIEYVNLSEYVHDAQHIIILNKENAENITINPTTEDIVSDNGKININTASKDELKTLTGIGDVISQNIIDYREENGGFSSIKEITEVSRIGDTIFANIEDDITIN